MPESRQVLKDALATAGVPSAITTMALAHASHLGRVQHVRKALLTDFRMKVGRETMEAYRRLP